MDDNSFFTLVEAVILAILAIVVFGSFKNFLIVFIVFSLVGIMHFGMTYGRNIIYGL